MNAERLLRHYERIADAPDAVARLRRFILDLAVRGKLVPQDAKDEPASELLKRIATTKAQLAKTGQRSELDHVPPAGDSFPVPKSWCWVSATYPARVISDQGKKVQTKDVLDFGQFPVVDQGKVFIRGYCDDPTKVIRVTEPVILFGDHTRETKLIDFDFVVGADGVKLLQPVGLLARYYFLALTWLPLDSRGYGRHFKLLKASRIPLPPLAEQHRIVAKVDELMGFCDRLEATRESREATRDRLAAASLARLNSPDPETFQADARFALDAMPALTTRPDQIKRLRQTILNLAVRGKLTAQRAEEGSAAEIVAKVLATRRTAWEASNRANKQYAAPEHESGLFEVPANWTWASALEVCHRIESGSTPSATEMSAGTGEIPYIKVYNLTLTGALDFSVNPTFIPRSVHDGKLARSKIVPGDVLMNIVGPPLGKVSLVPDTHPEWNTNQAVVLFRPTSVLSSRYLSLCLQSSAVLGWILGLAQQTVGQVNISVTKCRRLPIPIPPTAEQHRIVAEADELMTLCDRLEASLTAVVDTRRRLLDALLAEALAPSPTLKLEAAE